MNCPTCSTVVQDSDRFCEECGTALIADAISESDGCKKCGARPEALDAEGYCSHCGFRNQLATHLIEVTRSPGLGGATDPGLRHPNNEDALAIETDGTNHVLVVCDGVSSSQSPERASQIAAIATSRALMVALTNHAEPENALKTAIATALTEICAIAYQPGTDADPPSTTLVAAIVQDKTATIGWLGDSRAYWISLRGSCQLTRDDSWVSDQVDSGEMSAAEALHAPQSHAITRWLGADIHDDAVPSIVHFTLPGSGYLLLCSDGLWNYAPEPDQLADLIRRTASTDATAISRSLVEFARSQGGQDNITVALWVVS